MEEYYLKLRDVKLFSGLNESDYGEVLACLRAKVTEYKKGRILQLPGDTIKSLGIVMNGCIEISRTGITGNRLIVNRVEYPSMFGEAFIFAGLPQFPVTITALEDTSILRLDLKNIVNTSDLRCRYLNTIVKNMLSIMAEKNLFLSSRLELVTKKTIRAKLASYLMQILEQANCKEFDIPYNRNQLADYLSVNRSTMSNELSKLRQEGILDFHKNRFKIHKPILLSNLANSGGRNM